MPVTITPPTGTRRAFVTGTQAEVAAYLNENPRVCVETLSVAAPAKDILPTAIIIVALITRPWGTSDE